jgi:hypothetical protein
VQHVYFHSVCIRLLQISPHNLYLKREIDIGTIFKWNLHYPFAWDLDNLYSRYSVLEFFKTDYLRDFAFALNGDDQSRQFVNLQFEDSIDLSRYFKLGNVGSDEKGHGLAVFDGKLHVRDLLTVFDGLDGKNFI